MKHFTIGEMIYSSTAIKQGINNCGTNPEIERNMIALIENVLDPARIKLGKPIFVTSGFRCARLNQELKGARNSQHTVGEAADLQCIDEPTTQRLFDILQTMNVDQLIWEHNRQTGAKWIHVSYKRTGMNRNEVLKLEV